MTPSAETGLRKPKSTIREQLLTIFLAWVVLLGFPIFSADWLGIMFNAIFALLLVLVFGMAFRAHSERMETLENHILLFPEYSLRVSRWFNSAAPPVFTAKRHRT